MKVLLAPQVQRDRPALPGSPAPRGRLDPAVPMDAMDLKDPSDRRVQWVQLARLARKASQE